MADINAMVKWFTDRQGRVTYSMIHRNGSASYDCSSAVYYGLWSAGFKTSLTYAGNTETLFNCLEKNDWQKVPLINGSYKTQKGDIFIWGKRGNTLGAAGHTGVFYDNSDRIIHCNYGRNGISIDDHDTIWRINGCPDNTVYRYVGNQSGTTPSSGFKVGQKVTLMKHATHYYTRQSIPAWAKNKSYTVQQVKSVNMASSKRAYLLKEISSWVLEQDLS